MRKVNFHTLENLTVPPELIEKTLAIAEIDVSAAHRSTGRRGRRPLLAASVVLVVLAGISVYFFFGNKNIPVKPSDAPNGSITIDPNVSDTEPTGSDATEPQSERPTGTAAQSEAIDASSATQPTVVTPRGIVTATQSPSILPNDTPATESNNCLADAPGVPAPTSSAPPATEHQPVQTEKPTQLPYEPGTDPPEDFPGSGGGEVPGAPADAVIYSSVSSSLLTGHKHVYCVLYHRAGNRVDSEPILSPKHETIPSISSDGYAYFAYSPPEEWNLSTGMYEMEIYNENGKMIQREIVFLNYE